MLLIDLADPEYRCPISLEELEYPLQTPCGHNFEAHNIYGWLEQHLNCPCCKAELNFGDLEPNAELREAIQLAKRSLALENKAKTMIFSVIEQEQLDMECAQQLAREYALLDEQERSDAAYARTLAI